jgi:hypothetical protein
LLFSGSVQRELGTRVYLAPLYSHGTCIDVLPPPTTTPPGWYDDPWQPGGKRWWDGSTWTQNVAYPPSTTPRRLKALQITTLLLPVSAILLILSGWQVAISTGPTRTFAFLLVCINLALLFGWFVLAVWSGWVWVEHRIWGANLPSNSEPQPASVKVDLGRYVVPARNSEPQPASVKVGLGRYIVPALLSVSVYMVAVTALSFAVGEIPAFLLGIVVAVVLFRLVVRFTPKQQQSVNVGPHRYVVPVLLSVLVCIVAGGALSLVIGPFGLPGGLLLAVVFARLYMRFVVERENRQRRQ